MADQRPLSAFENLPTELVVDVFCKLDTPSDIHSLLLTSKALYGVFAGSENYIAKAHTLALLSPDDYKLAVMAIESRKVDPFCQESIQEFFDDYLNPHCEEWDLRLFRIHTVGHLPELIKATSVLVQDMDTFYFWFPNNRRIIIESPTEFARKARAYYIRDIAINLFYRATGNNGILPGKFYTAYESMATKYWMKFSPGEIAQVLALCDHWLILLLDLRMYYGSLTCDGNNPLCLGGGEIPKESVHLARNADQFDVEFLFQLASIQDIYYWRCPNVSSPHSRLKEQLKFRKEPFGTSILEEFERHARSPPMLAQEFGRPPFHPDPESISEDVWYMDSLHWEEVEDIYLPEEWKGFLEERIFWDKDTVKKLRKRLGQ
ncbi:hypothetical protein M434DRAFT_385522 [Hypoxylon sp. CO27-5]|nr:hypothetical protein M434DRAFT_385522 [Hypoxylon sp. CO27-5]